MSDERHSFDILAAEHRGMVLAYCLGILDDPHLAEDLTQETFLVAHRRLEEFCAGGDFGAWLRGIARNEIRESRRTAARRHLVVDSEVVAGMEDIYAGFGGGPPREAWMERLAAVRSCIGALPELMRRAMELVYGADLEVAEAAARSGASADTFQRRLSRAREKVRECVENRLGLGGN